MTRRLVALALLVAVAGVGFVVVNDTMPGWYARIRYPLEYESIVAGHARNYDLDPALLAAVIYQESRFDPDARSPSGALGLMQLLPSTAKGIAVHTGGTRFRVDDLFNPELNVRYGSYYLRRLLRKYGEVDLALAAYNAGQANVDRWLEGSGEVEFAETRAYVESVLEARDAYAKAYRGELEER